jgi:hypothetical protein
VAFAGAAVDDAADVDEAEDDQSPSACSLRLRRPLTKLGDCGFDEASRPRWYPRSSASYKNKTNEGNKHAEKTGGHEMTRDAPVNHVNVVE